MASLLPRIEIDTDDDPRAAVIWLHGLGADGSDFAPLVGELDLSACPPIRFVFPHAPAMPVTLNGGYVMPAWYDIRGSALVREEDATGIARSARAIEALIDHEIQRGIPPHAIVLAGFSQGCAMALHTGLRHPKRLAGIIALSGYLPLADTLNAERSQANLATPIFMAHGEQDPVVALDRALASHQQLTLQGYQVQWHAYDMEHSVHPREVADIASFLRRVLGRASGTSIA